MRILLGGIKGGVGKTTLTLLLGRSLARRGRKVLIVDRDLIGWASKVLGVTNDEGLLNSVLEGRTDGYYASTHIGKGKLGVVRFYPVSHTFKTSVDFVLRKPELMEAVSKAYGELLLDEGYDLFIVDNPPNVLPSDPVVKLEVQAFYKWTKADVAHLYVSDPTQFGIEAVVRYAEYVQSDPELIPPVHRGLVVNMVRPLPDEEAMAQRKALEACERIMADLCGTIPFDDSLFDYGDRSEEYPEEVNNLAAQVAEWDDS
ncbi:hypothetical protein HS1genome_2213 [Sulfodiicoccus acidiphilus]|uniref:CobQ/CobB/MinD/ParA nucleotide binding domain-containing protein n=1 Tax=Sulfodiicoccus acidiphilus TaxID=1670455 RepID=A0A348B6M2_9CREN|nr:ParA family protein [Sulfodiicoccus acidiphilus]BBD73824.1 hypothetical protein HS1genome_2213 [Sulfodiicoccus acidiphilus]GGT96478.1 hypothetical protein GCM10007116_12600 [Sulfodiicoccus acidiphilus]